jgi:protein disulfide-isomerase
MVASTAGTYPAGAPMGPASIATSPAPAYASQSPVQPMAASIPGLQPPVMAARSPITPSLGEKPAQPAGGNAPLCLDGYCPVTLCERQQWVLGDRRFGAIHRGRTYLFTGPEEQRRFLSNPDQYAPAFSGSDLVLAMDQRQTVPGMREHGVFFGNRVYLFATEASLEKFSKNPNLYANYASEMLHASNSPGRQMQ